MLDSSLLARYIMEYGPLKIARKDSTMNPDTKPFDKWARKDWNIYEVEAEEAEKLLKNNSYAFLIAIILNQGKLIWKAWRGPYLIKRELKIRSLSPKIIYEIDQRKINTAVKKAKLGCRNLPADRAGKYIKSAAKRVLDTYSGKASLIWKNATSVKELRNRLIKFDGIGENLANMAIKIFLEKGMIPKIPKTSEELRNLQVKADVHVIKVLYRTGLSEANTEDAALKAAKKYCPSLPARIDSGALEIGIQYCFKTDPDCKHCPLYKKRNSKINLCRRKI